MDVNLGEGLLEKDIKAVLSAKTTNPNKKSVWYSVVIHTVDIDLALPLLDSVLTYRDYNTSYGDETIVLVAVGMGDYIKDIYPHRDNLEMSLVRTDTKYVTTLRFKAVINSGTSIPKGEKYDKLTKDDLNKSEIATLEIQLVDRYVELLRSTPIDGVFRFCNVEACVKAAFNDTFNNAKVAGRNPKMMFNMVKPNNTFTYKHVEIPTGTTILNLPTYLQETQYGIYNGKIGTYFQLYGPKLEETLFVFPLYSTSLFDKSTKKMIIFKSNNPRLDMVDNTYFLDGDILKIIAGSNTVAIDNSDSKMISNGGDVVTTNPDTTVQRNNMVQGGKLTTVSSTNLKGTTIKKRKDGSNSFKYVGADSNPYKHRSKVLEDNSRHFRIPWSYSAPEHVFPGMPVMYVYEDVDKGIIKLYGVVSNIFNKYEGKSRTINSIIDINVMEKE